MSYTLGEAAKATGKSKPTIQRAIKSGKISAKKKEDGSYVIEPSEVHRVYPLKQGNGCVSVDMKQDETVSDTSALQGEIEVLRRELDQVASAHARESELMQQQIDLYKERLERADKDKDQLTALLTLRKEQDVPDAHKAKGFWARLKG